MESGLLAILRQDNQQIGLFDPLRIHQEIRGHSHQILWLRPKHRAMGTLVSIRPVLTPDPVFFTITVESLPVLDAERPVFNRWGAIELDHVIQSTVTRIPYVVQFWEDSEFVPVYTVFPDYALPWNRTLRSAVSLPIHRPLEVLTVPRLRDNPRSTLLRDPLRVRPTEPLTDLPPLPADAICTITLDPLTVETAYWTPCAHAFSISILQALELDPRCPLCRRYCYASDCRKAT
jgi:hypothetical protein